MKSVQVSVGELVDRITFRFEDGTRADYGGEGGTVQEEFALEVGEELDTAYVVTLHRLPDLGSVLSKILARRMVPFIRARPVSYW